MLSQDVTIEDFAAEDWLHLRSLVGAQREQRAPGLVLFVREDGSVYKAFRGGRRTEPSQYEAKPLQSLVAAGVARWVARLRAGALEDCVERWSARLVPGQTLLAQALELGRVLQEMVQTGQLEVYPYRLDRVPVPSESSVDRWFDPICPVGKTLLFASFERGAVASCVAARRGTDGFDRIVGPESLRRDMGLVSRDWTRDYQHLARATELGVGSLSVGCFAESRTWRRLLSGASPGAWAAAVAARDIVLHPVVPALAIPLGLDVGRAAVATVRELARRLGVSSALSQSSFWSPALSKARALAESDLDLERILGFDPIGLLREALGQNEDPWQE